MILMVRERITHQTDCEQQNTNEVGANHNVGAASVENVVG